MRQGEIADKNLGRIFMAKYLQLFMNCLDNTVRKEEVLHFLILYTDQRIVVIA